MVSHPVFDNVQFTEPRSLTVLPDNWLTDSRVYNLIWLGRWLERAESVSRTVNAAARRVQSAGGDSDDFAAALGRIAATRGIVVESPEKAAGEVLLRHPASSVLQCLAKARMNATQVAPVELIRDISALILDLENLDDATLGTPEPVIAVTDAIAARISNIDQTIEDRWFGRESLTEEEVFRRFVQ